MSSILFYNNNGNCLPNSLPTMKSGKLNCKVRLRTDYVTDKKHSVYIQVSLNRVVKRIPLGISVLAKDFDIKNQRVRLRHQNANDYNLIIEKKLADINTVEINYRLQGKTVSLESLIEDLNNPTARIDFIRFWTDEMERQKGMIGAGTHKQQNSSLSKVKTFKNPILFYEINSELIEDLKSYYKKKGNNANTIATLVKNVKKYLNIAKKRGINYPVEFSDIKNGAFKGNRTFLSEDEIKRLYKTYNDEYCNANYKEIIGMFLFCCFTGIRYSDVIKLTQENIIENTLVFTAEKTGKFQRIRLNQAALKFIGEKKDLFPKHTNEYVNRELKLIAKATGIEKVLTFHVSRHSFATNFLIRGGRVEHLQKLLGHSKIEDTMIYVHIVEDITNGQIDNMEGILDFDI